MTVFDFSSSGRVFAAMLEAHKDERGYKTRLAKAATVHPSYVTRIAQGQASITPDQAAALASFWGLRTSEKEYFLWLVLRGRSGDESMVALADERIRQLKKAHDELGSSLPAEKVDPLAENKYYMSWVYSAVHLLSALPGQTAAQVARRLALPEPVVTAAAGFLDRIGLVKIRGGKLLKTERQNVHLSNESWMASLQHRNWRVASADRIGRPADGDMRYTGVHSLSKPDLEELRRHFREFLLRTDRLVRPSKDETVCVLCMDLFEL